MLAQVLAKPAGVGHDFTGRGEEGIDDMENEAPLQGHGKLRRQRRDPGGRHQGEGHEHVK